MAEYPENPVEGRAFFYDGLNRTLYLLLTDGTERTITDWDYYAGKHERWHRRTYKGSIMITDGRHTRLVQKYADELFAVSPEQLVELVRRGAAWQRLKYLFRGD